MSRLRCSFILTETHSFQGISPGPRDVIGSVELENYRLLSLPIVLGP
jgi:hypothetical protein